VEIDRHISEGCAICMQGVRRGALTNAAILSFAPEAEPPKRLKKKLSAAIGIEPRHWGWLAWAAASACLLVATLWFSTEAHRRGADLAQADTQIRQLLNVLNSPETRQVNFGQGTTQPPKGNVFVNPSSGVLLIAANLPQLPSGKTYQMWVIPKGGSPKPAGVFSSDVRGSAVHLSPGPVDLSTTGAVAVSVEPESGSQAPTTTPVIVAPLSGM
jgi:hypothetical protein